MDAVSLSTGDTVYSSSNDSLVNLGQSGWQGAEFNVFGNGDSSEATLNAGSRMAVRISVNDGTTDIPECRMGGTTGESNNLTLVPPCCPYGGPSPAIVFWQSSNRGATSMCASGSSMGDTHLTNFAGLLFDFQASGDFLLAETNPDFVVQTRQASGAPTWPDASVNKAVAIKMERLALRSVLGQRGLSSMAICHICVTAGRFRSPALRSREMEMHIFSPARAARTCAPTSTTAGSTFLSAWAARPRRGSVAYLATLTEIQGRTISRRAAEHS